MQAAVTATASHGIRDKCGQASRGRYRGSQRAGRDDGTRDAARGPLFAELVQHPADLLLRCACEPVGGGHTRARVHSHVERTIAHDAESAFGLVELGRRDAEIHQHRIDVARESGCTDDCTDIAEACVVDRDPWIDAGQLACDRHRLRIAVDRQHPPVRSDAIEHRPRVPATSERAIDVAATGTRRKRLHDLVEHDRNMLRRLTAHG